MDGRFVDLPHDRAVPVDAAQLHALENSNILFEIVAGADASAPELDPDHFLDRPIRVLAPELPALGAGRIAELVAAEAARPKPRVTLLARLNRRAAAARNPGDML